MKKISLRQFLTKVNRKKPRIETVLLKLPWHCRLSKRERKILNSWRNRSVHHLDVANNFSDRDWVLREVAKKAHYQEVHDRSWEAIKADLGPEWK